MAFTTTQTLDNVLMRGLTFRTPANAAISSQYSLYANGIGQTYWSNSVTQAQISSLSTSLGVESQKISTSASVVTTALSSQISSLNSTFQVQSTQIGLLEIGLVSTTAQLLANDAALSNANTQLKKQVDSIYTSTLNFTYSTIAGISSISTFTNEIAAVQSSVYQSYSTLSSFIILQNASTYTALTANYTAALNKGLASTTYYINQQISSISSVVG